MRDFWGKKTLKGIYRVFMNKSEQEILELRNDQEKIVRALQNDQEKMVRALQKDQEQKRHEDIARMEDYSKGLYQDLYQTIFFDLPPVLENNGIIDKEQYLSKEIQVENGHPNADTFYTALAAAFRGSDEAVRAPLEMLIPYIFRSGRREAPFIDFGCGDGAFLDVLRDHQIHAIGVDYNIESLNKAKEKGHEVICDRAENYISSYEDGTIGGISLIMVAEHIPFEILYEDIFLFSRKLMSGGVLLFNTINPYCYSRYGNFRLDPSHINFTPPELYKVVFEMAGLESIKIVWSAPIDMVARTPDWFTQYENFTIFGYKK